MRSVRSVCVCVCVGGGGGGGGERERKRKGGHASRAEVVHMAKLFRAQNLTCSSMTHQTHHYSVF